MSDVEDYLQEGFDPRAVTVPRLRSILVTHNIQFGNAKKPQLVALVEEHIMPAVPKLREQRARAKRSSMGIVNAGSADDNPAWDDYDLAPPPSARRSKSPRKSSTRASSSRIKSEEVEDTPVQRSPAKRASRSVSRALSHAEETPEYEAPRSVRRNRRTVTPQIKSEPDDDMPSLQEDSVFTDDNPFQGKSSPSQPKTPGSRRRTSDFKSNRSSLEGSVRRRTGEYEDVKPLIVPKTRHQFTPQYDDDDDDDEDDDEDASEPGEEFTPDAQLELEEAAHKGEILLPVRHVSRSPSRSFSLSTPIFTLFLVLLGSYGVWYRQEKIAVGYCGLGRPANELLPPEVPVPAFLIPFVEPQCEQCPAHAYCYGDFEARCEPDFVLQPHPLALGGLIPLPPSCEPDGEKARRVHAVADKAVEELRERRAKYECGELVDEEGNRQDSPSMLEEDLKETVSRKRSKRLNSAEFEDLWAAALGEVTSREEIEVETIQASSPTGIPNRRISSTSLARIPLTCAIKRSIRLGLEKHRFTIGLLISFVTFVLYLRYRYRKHVSTSAQIPALVDQVLARLANQKELGDEEIDDPWLFLPNLRDDVLRAVHSLSERERIWQRVKAVVDQNSNIRTSQREGRSGEVGRAWEWIGPTAGEGARRRRSGRVSWISDTKTESPEPSKQVPEVKKWEEARPIY
ncbi:hypothetical protein V2G26_014377 [Clonostachys chloroleuca]